MQHSTINHNNRRLAYVHSQSTSDNRPSVFFCGGFNSNMQGLKALALEEYCRAKDLSFTRFDYSGHGSSEGLFEEGDIGSWLSDTLCVFDHTTTTPHGSVVIGSSMGAWIATLLAIQRGDQVTGLITIAAAPDFTEKLLLPALNTSQREALIDGETLFLPSKYDDGSPYPISAALINQSRKHCVLDKPIPLNIPVHLLHGTGDTDVPHALSLQLMETIQTNDIRLTLIKNADHRLSNESELRIITHAIDEMLGNLAIRNSG